MFMKKTSTRPDYVAIYQTEFLYLNDTCLEIFYVFTGHTDSATLTVKLRQEVSFTLNLDVYKTQKHG